MTTTYRYSLAFTGNDRDHSIVILVVEANLFGVVKDTQQMCLNSVRITRLTKNLQQRWIRDEEEPREEQPLLLQVSS